jgi:hypothetical protein
MFEQGQCDNKTAYKHTGHPLAHCYGPQTRPRAAPCSQLPRQCAAKLHYHRYLRSDGTRRPYSDRLRTRRGGIAYHRVCSALVPGTFRKWVP